MKGPWSIVRKELTLDSLFRVPVMVVDDGYPRSIKKANRPSTLFHFKLHPSYDLAAPQPIAWRKEAPQMFDTQQPFDQARLAHLRERLERYC